MIEATPPVGAPRHQKARRLRRQRGRAAEPWDDRLLAELIRELSVIRSDLVRLERDFTPALRDAHPAFRRSARNLVHYLALRRHDIRGLQERLATLGLSSLGRTETHVMTGVDAVLGILCHLADRTTDASTPASPPIGFAEGNALLAAHTETLLGPRPPQRSVRIMVTMPTEAAHDYEFVRQLVAHGMDCMRINCAHDDAAAWSGMVANLRRARKELGRDCRILMDLAGPKLRTGAIDPSSQILRWKPQRNASGEVVLPARIWLADAEQPCPPAGPADACLHLSAEGIRRARRGERFAFTDMRGKRRTLELGSTAAGGRWASAAQTAYVREGRTLRLTTAARARRGRRATRLDAVPRAASPDQHFLTLKPGDTLVLTRAPILGKPAVVDERGCVVSPATLSCTLGEAFADIRPQERIWFDDGKIGGVIESVMPDGLHVRITSGRSIGEKLRADKGINLPDSRLRLAALTDKDVADLNFVVQHADLVGLSFVRTPGDVRDLQTHLARLGATQLSIVLKIETTTAFEHLPALLLAAMRAERVGVMIARGDLAVECGYERLAEVQEEVLWFCEAAHVPVIWATQVLESLAKKGVPSRAEITDAAMGERAECVMLNKGPHLVDAVRVLQDILQRMEAHQSKKSARLRRLRLSAIAASA